MIFEDAGHSARLVNPPAKRVPLPKHRANTMPAELVDISALQIVPISDGPMPEGFYMGRKRSWNLDASFVTVMLLLSDDEPRVLEVHEPGQRRVSYPREWLFVGRVIGLRDVTAAYRRAAEAWARGEAGTA
jgi:hypothetical protein